MIILVALGAAQGAVLLDAMAKDLAKSTRLNGTLVVSRPGQAPAKAVFHLTKPNRFQVKGAGIDVWFDGKTRHDLKNGKWVPSGTDGTLPVALRGFESFFGKKVVATGPAVRTKGIPGVGYPVAENVVFYINEKTRLPVSRSRVDANGKAVWVYFKDIKPAQKLIVQKSDMQSVARKEEPKPMTTGVTVPLSMGDAVTTLVPLKTDELERPNPPVPVANVNVPNEATANLKVDQASIKETPEELAAKLPKVGDDAKLFTANLPSGAPVELAKIIQKSSGVVLVFWHANCPASGDYFPYLETQRAQMAKDKVSLLGINVGDASGLVKQFLADKKSGITSVLGSEVAEMYGVSAFPTTVVLDDNGKVVASFIGVNESALKAALDSIKPKS